MPSRVSVPASGLHPLRPVTGTYAEVWAALRTWWDDPDGPVVVRTSGSSGAPKDVALSHAALSASASASLDRLGGAGRWVLDLPVATVAGLQVLVRSLLGGTEPVVVGARSEERAGFARGTRAYTSLVPTQLYRHDRAGTLGSLAGFDAVLVGGAPTELSLLDRARAAGVRVVTTYGMTETSGGCVYDGLGLDGVAVRVAADGRIHLAGPMLFDGYAGDEAATAAVLREGWLCTRDLGRLDDEGRLVVTGRADDMVLSGGVSVHLTTVEGAIRTHPTVAEAAAVAVDDREWGQRVVAVVVPRGAAATLAELRDHVASTVPRSWAPRELVVVDALPRLAGHKLDRLSLSRLASEGAPNQR